MTDISAGQIVADLRKRYKASCLDAIVSAASDLNLTYERVRDTWVQRFGGFEFGQEKSLSFLLLDHTEPTIHFPLPWHPLARELELLPGDMLADFSDSCFIIYTDGQFSPYNRVPLPEAISFDPQTVEAPASDEPLSGS